MSTLRFFSGSRDPGKKSVASEIMRLEIEKKGKMDPADRFKFILKKKMEENKKKAGFAVGGSANAQLGRPMSQKAERALKELAAKKAAKEAKKMRKMVFIEPRRFTNGKLDKKGIISDIQGNRVGKVNKLNGKMTTQNGWAIGKYKSRSMQTKALIEEAIYKHSPYFVNMRKMQAMQQAGIDPVTGQAVNPQDTMNVHGVRGGAGGMGGVSAGMLASGYGHGGDLHQQGFASYGEAAQGPRQNVGVTAFGVHSDNIWGTFSDNVWGRSLDNVWGGVNGDVWGLTTGGLFKGRSIQIFGTGNGKNYLKAVTTGLRRLLGLTSKNARQTLKTAKSTRGQRQGQTVARAPARASAPARRTR